MGEQSVNTTINTTQLLKITKLSSCENIFNFNKSIYLENEYRLKYKRKFNSVDKLLNISVNNNLNISQFKKSNFIGNNTYKIYKNKDNCKKNINNILIPVNNASIKNPQELNKTNEKDIKSISNQNKNKKEKKTEIFSQKIDISIMKEEPPKIPELFSHNYKLKNNNIIEKYNETCEKLDRGTIPITFYGHIMTSENKIKNINNRNKYHKSSITQRNKNKLITIVYFSP